jgi:hypothetical protein
LLVVPALYSARPLPSPPEARPHGDRCNTVRIRYGSAAMTLRRKAASVIIVAAG